MIKISLELKDLDVSKRTKEMFNVVSKSIIEVGVFGDQGSDLVIYAASNEFGTRTKNGKVHIPQRSFLRSAIDLNTLEIRQFIQEQLFLVLHEEIDDRTALNKIGVYLVGLVQERISSNIPPPNKPITVERKKSSKTLIDTGRLRQSITYRIKEYNG